MSEKVLLVDDEEDLLEAVAERMRLLGIDVSTSSTPHNALKKVKKENYDAIILDLTMPGMGGFSTLKAIKKLNPYLQVIILTANATTSMSKEAKKLGAMDLMEKPADLNKLLKKVRKARKIRKDQQKAVRHKN